MKDTREWAEKLRREAEECRLISKLATNPAKRDTFARLAEGHDRQAETLRRLSLREICKTLQWQEPENNRN
jgi:hypothetical protein